MATKSFLLVLRVPSLELTQESWVLCCALQLKKLLLIITMSWSASKTLFALGLLCCGLTTSCHVNSNGKIINMVTLLTEVSNQGIYLGYWFSSPWACLRFISWAPTEKKSARPMQTRALVEVALKEKPGCTQPWPQLFPLLLIRHDKLIIKNLKSFYHMCIFKQLHFI